MKLKNFEYMFTMSRGEDPRNHCCKCGKKLAGEDGFLRLGTKSFKRDNWGYRKERVDYLRLCPPCVNEIMCFYQAKFKSRKRDYTTSMKKQVLRGLN